MPKDTVFNPTDLGTLRPNEPPIPKAGAAFQPLETDDRPTHIHLPDGVTPLDLYSLFKLYYLLEIIERIVDATNQYTRKIGASNNARRMGWYATCIQEIYIYFALRIYIMICMLPELANY